VFTGLIQSAGYLQALGARQLCVQCCDTTFAQMLAIGDSVSVDGVCLTAETVTDANFVATVSPETLRRTTLGTALQTGWCANLEPALRVGDRLGGHFVTGHVDGVAQVERVIQTAESWEISFAVEPALGRYILPKGSVALNGISLTVADCTADGTEFKVAVIPHSFAQTNLQALTPQMLVNVETDLLGKYVAKLLSCPDTLATVAPTPDISLEFLAEHGFV
jgi:riboflavin synthase